MSSQRQWSGSPGYFGVTRQGKAYPRGIASRGQCRDGFPSLRSSVDVKPELVQPGRGKEADAGAADPLALSNCLRAGGIPWRRQEGSFSPGQAAAGCPAPPCPTGEGQR